MSIEVNGVTLPDIPEDVLASYPYAVISYIEPVSFFIGEADYTENAGDPFYELTVSKAPGYLAPGELAEVEEGYDFEKCIFAAETTEVASFTLSNDTTTWEVSIEPVQTRELSAEGTVNVTGDGYTMELEYSIVWSNYNIYTATADDSGNITPTDTVYFYSSTANYFAPKSWYDGMARQVRRLTGTTEKLTTTEMLEDLKGVEVGGGGGGSGDGVSVTFVSEGATVGSSFVLTGQKITSPGMESTDTHVFAGWYTAADGGGEKISFPYAPTEDITLYAYWVERYVIGVTGLNGSSGVLTYTGTVPDGIALETAASSGYVSVSSPLDNVWPFNAIEEFTDDSGNVFIKFPQFWMRWVYDLDGGLDGYEISNTQAESDFFIPDAFLEPDCFGASAHRYLDYFALGKYEASGSSSMMYSKTGATCLVSITRANARAAARAYGDSSNYYNGYQQLDLAQLTAYNLLAMFYLGTTNVQSVYGGRTGSGQNTWSAASVTGTTDGVTTLTGWNMNTDCVKILGVENPFGNVYKWVDGVYFSGTTIYVHKFPQHYAESTTNGKAMGFSRPTSSAYISKLSHGTASDTPLSDVRSFLYASAVSGSASTYCGDNCYYNSSGVVLCSGGRWYGGAEAGLWSLYGPASSALSYVGARLSYRPL